VRYSFAQRFGEALGITAQQHHRTAEARHRLTQRSKVSTFAVTAGDQHQLASDIRAQAFDRCQRSTDVGGLGVVVPIDTIALTHPLATMGQAAKLAQGVEHRCKRQASGMAEGQGCEGVAVVVRTANFQFAHGHQVLEFERQVLLAVDLTQAERFEVRLVQAKAPARPAFHRQWPAQRVLAVHHHLMSAPEDTVLGQVVSRQAAVAVHVVFADVQHGGDFGVELVCGFQLEAGQLQHIQLHLIAQQVQGWCAEVTAHGHALARLGSHFADQGGHCAFCVGAADGDDWRFGMAGEQLDVARQGHTPCRSLLQRRGGQGQARAHVQFVGAAQEVHVQLATAHFHLRVITAQGVQFRRLLAGVGDRKGNAPARQEANQGHAALAEADNDAELVGSDQ